MIYLYYIYTLYYIYYIIIYVSHHENLYANGFMSTSPAPPLEAKMTPKEAAYGKGYCLQTLAHVLCAELRPDEGLPHGEQSVQLFAEVKDLRGEAMARAVMAYQAGVFSMDFPWICHPFRGVWAYFLMVLARFSRIFRFLRRVSVPKDTFFMAPKPLG